MWVLLCLPGPRTLGGLLLELYAGAYLLFWSSFTRICGAQCYASFSVSVPTFSQVTFRLQVPCLRLPLFLSDHESAEVSGIWGRSRVTAPAGSLHCVAAPCHEADLLRPCCVRRLGCSRLLQLLVGAPCIGCVLLVPLSCYFSTSVWRAFSAKQLGVICTCCFAYFLDRSTGCSVLSDLCAEYSLTLMHQAPLVVKCGGLWSVTFACRCFGTISREEGWEEWVLLLPPGQGPGGPPSGVVY